MKRALLLTTLLTLALPAVARAHPLAPTAWRLEVREGGLVSSVWRTPSIRPRGVRPAAPMWPAQCELTEAPRPSHLGAAIELRTTARCEGGLEGATLRVSGLAGSQTNVIVQITHPGGAVTRELLRDGHASVVVRTPQADEAGGVVFVDFLSLGVRHLLGGLDHVLFILGLLLIVRRARDLVAVVTAFTVGHSVSLGLSALGHITLPSAPVEVAIAISLLVVGLRAALDVDEGDSKPREEIGWTLRRGALLALAFGLLHGLGFAGAFSEAGVAPADVPVALFAFNVGVEIGQLGIVFAAIAFDRLVVARLSDTRRPTLRAGGAMTIAYVIGAASAYWIIERTPAALAWVAAVT